MHKTTSRAWLAQQCAKATTFAELAEVAKVELDKFDGHAEIVCGPITTGGLGTPEANLRIFGKVIELLAAGGAPIFNQAPYEDKIFELRNKWRAEDPARENQYYLPILFEFYAPLFATCAFKKGHFIPGWRSSKDVSWEHDELKRLGAEIKYLPQGFIENAKGLL